MFESGNFAVPYCTLPPFSSRNVNASASALLNPVSPKIGTSKRRP